MINQHSSFWTFPRVFALIMLLMILGSFTMVYNSIFSQALRDQKPVFGIVLGTDWVDRSRHSDTLLVVRYDPARRWLDILSIPRDTQINIPGLKLKRINEVYTYANRQKPGDSEFASQKVIQAVQWLLFNSSDTQKSDFKIEYFCQIDYTGFRKIIDELGGIPVQVDEPMHYDDYSGQLHIHFDPGNYWMNGKQALEYVRFRGLSGDFGRRYRQQNFFLNVFKPFKTPFKFVEVTPTCLCLITKY